MEILDEELVGLNMECHSDEEVIRALGRKLLDKGKVKPSYVEAAVEREKIYPTGLPGAEINVAIPHTDASYVNQPAIAIGTLSKPVLFKMMGNPDQALPVDIVIMLAVNDPKSQLDVLKKLMEVFRDAAILRRLKSAASTVEVREVLNGAMSNK